MNLLLIIVVVMIFDYLTKYYIVETMIEGMSIPVIEGIFHITYILNAGAAFGMMENQRFVFIAVAVAMMAAFAYYFREIKLQGLVFQVGVGLLVGGALGNLIDRVKLGKVIDFLDFRIWPVFNVADIAICVGAGLILWDVLKKKD